MKYWHLDLSRRGRVACWSKPSPFGRHHLYVRREIGGRICGGLLSFDSLGDLKRVKASVIQRWEANNFTISARASAHLSEYLRWKRLEKR